MHIIHYICIYVNKIGKKPHKCDPKITSKFFQVVFFLKFFKEQVLLLPF